MLDNKCRELAESAGCYAEMLHVCTVAQVFPAAVQAQLLIRLRRYRDYCTAALALAELGI